MEKYTPEELERLAKEASALSVKPDAALLEKIKSSRETEEYKARVAELNTSLESVKQNNGGGKQ